MSPYAKTTIAPDGQPTIPWTIEYVAHFVPPGRPPQYPLVYPMLTAPMASEYNPIVGQCGACGQLLYRFMDYSCSRTDCPLAMRFAT